MSKEVNINTKSYLNTGLYVVILFIASIYLNGIISVPSQDVIINGEVVGVTEGIYTYFFYSKQYLFSTSKNVSNNHHTTQDFTPLLAIKFYHLHDCPLAHWTERIATEMVHKAILHRTI